jgi:hypothetical protein
MKTNQSLQCKLAVQEREKLPHVLNSVPIYANFLTLFFAVNFCISFEIKIHFSLPLLLIFILFYSHFILQLQGKKKSCGVP